MGFFGYQDDDMIVSNISNIIRDNHIVLKTGFLFRIFKSSFKFWMMI